LRCGGPFLTDDFGFFDLSEMIQATLQRLVLGNLSSDPADRFAVSTKWILEGEAF